MINNLLDTSYCFSKPPNNLNELSKITPVFEIEK